MSEQVNIYALYDSREPNHYRYIGQTVRSVNTRLQEHIAESKFERKKSKSYNTHKDNWVRKVTDKGDVVKARLLKTVPKNKADVEETKIIIAFKSFGHKLTNISMSATCDNYKSWKAVDCYDIGGNFIGEFDSIGKAARAMRLEKCAIVNQLKGRQTTCKGYIFTYKGDSEELNKRLEILNTQKQITKKIDYPKVGKNVIYVYDSKGNYIRFYRSTAHASKHLNFSKKIIYYSIRENKIILNKYYFCNSKKFQPKERHDISCPVIMSSVFEELKFNSIGELCRYMIDKRITKSISFDTFRKSICDKLNSSLSHTFKYKCYVIHKTSRGVGKKEI